MHVMSLTQLWTSVADAEIFRNLISSYCRYLGIFTPIALFHFSLSFAFIRPSRWASSNMFTGIVEVTGSTYSFP